MVIGCLWGCGKNEKDSLINCNCKDIVIPSWHLRITACCLRRMFSEFVWYYVAQKAQSCPSWHLEMHFGLKRRLGTQTLLHSTYLTSPGSSSLIMGCSNGSPLRERCSSTDSEHQCQEAGDGEKNVRNMMNHKQHSAFESWVSSI